VFIFCREVLPITQSLPLFYGFTPDIYASDRAQVQADMRSYQQVQQLHDFPCNNIVSTRSSSSYEDIQRVSEAFAEDFRARQFASRNGGTRNIITSPASLPCIALHHQYLGLQLYSTYLLERAMHDENSGPYTSFSTSGDNELSSHVRQYFRYNT